jgi:cobalt-zinc-cadmium efflux system outer membrane protein
MLLCSPRPWAFGVALVISAGLHAQPAPSLREAADAAWSLTPQARSAQQRQAELDARGRAASSFLAGPPAVGLSHRTDRVGSNAGQRETEAELSAPLWWPGVRRATAAQVDADRSALDSQQQLARLKLAAEVRELAGEAALAQIDRELAARKAQEAQVLAADVSRRVKAGESARVDQLQAESALQQAAAAQSQAEATLARLQAQWRALTGLERIAPLDEAPGQPADNPTVAAAQGAVRAAEAKLQLTSADQRDPLEVGVGVTRERPAFGAGNERSMTLSVRIPLGSDGRNAAKLSAARAELDAAQAEADATRRAADAQRLAAVAELEAARSAEAAAAQRARLAGEVQALIAKSFRLGESDLPTRLRAEAERFDAERAHARAQVEARRAISKLNQAYGLLP